MANEHVCYMKGGSIISPVSGIIDEPAILVSKVADTIHHWGNAEYVKAEFDRYVAAFNKGGMTEEAEDLMFIELSEYHDVTHEMACYIIRRAAEFTLSGFITRLCKELTEGSDPVTWLKNEMETFPLELDEK